MPRGKRKPPRVERTVEVTQLLHNLRLAHRNVLVAEGHLIAHRQGETDAARAAFAAGATHEEICLATGTRYFPGKVAAPLTRYRRGAPTAALARRQQSA